MAQIEIIGSTLSNYVWTVAIACAEKGVDFVVRPARPHSPEVDAIHPLGRIPCMRHGDLTLFESRAICAYVDAAFEGPALTPRDPREAARLEQWISLLITSADPVLVRGYVLAYLFPGTPDGAPDRARIDAIAPKLDAHLRIFEAQVSEGFVAGSGFTLADAYLVPMLAGVNRFPEGAAMIAGSPKLAAYLKTQLGRASVKSTMPQPPKG